jgi:Protein of unknown function (DUF3617)
MIPPFARGDSMNRATMLIATLLVPSLAAAAPPPPAAREPGVEWEQTVEMQMSGFSMPPQTSTVCVPTKGMAEPPGSGRPDDRCKVTNVRNDGKTMSWSIVCEGDEKMSGEGEIAQRPDGYDGKMTMRSAQGEMHMKLRGKKLGGECDAGKMRREVAALQAQGASQAAQACREMAGRLALAAFAGAQPVCADPADRKVLCQRAATREGIRVLAPQPATMTRDLGSLCGADLAAMTSRACSDAAREEAADRKGDAGGDLLDFIGSTCPTETRAIAQRECAGRTYTDLPSRYRSFCTAYAANLLDKGKKPAAEPPKPEDAAQEAAKKAVKGLLPW